METAQVQPQVVEYKPIKDKEVVKCPNCKKGIMVNYAKHPNRKEITCPHCLAHLKQSYFDKDWKSNPAFAHVSKSKPFTVEAMRNALQNFKKEIQKKVWEDSPEGKEAKRKQEMLKEINAKNPRLDTPDIGSPRPVRKSIKRIPVVLKDGKLVPKEDEKKDGTKTSVDK